MRSLFALSARERFFLLGLFGFLFLGLSVVLTMGLIGEVDLNRGGTYCIDYEINKDPQACDRDTLKIVLHHLEVVALSTAIVVLPAAAFVTLCLMACRFVPAVEGRGGRASRVADAPHATRQRPNEG